MAQDAILNSKQEAEIEQRGRTLTRTSVLSLQNQRRDAEPDPIRNLKHQKSLDEEDEDPYDDVASEDYESGNENVTELDDVEADLAQKG